MRDVPARAQWLAMLMMIAVGSGVVYWAIATPPAAPPISDITLARFDRLHAGMTLGEVQAIMGRKWDHTYYMSFSTTYLWFEDAGLVSIRDTGIERSGNYRKYRPGLSDD